MYDHLDKLTTDLVAYREAADQIFSPTLLTPADQQQYFFELLICTSQLYLDYLIVLKDSSGYETNRSEISRDKLPKTNSHREQIHRQRFSEQLESSPHWAYFAPRNPFSDLTGLETLQDYIEKFTLHLPEIYEETFRIEECVKSFQTNHSDSVLAHLIVGLEHMRRNHISFVQQALEWAAQDMSWAEPSIPHPKRAPTRRKV